MSKLFKNLTLILLSITLVSCATIVNDAHIPVSLSFSDGSDGECKLSNKRQSLSGEVPATFMVRRSDDALRVDCTTKSGKKGFVSIRIHMLYKLPLFVFVTFLKRKYKNTIFTNTTMFFIIQFITKKTPSELTKGVL